MPEHTPAPSPHRAVYGFAMYLLFFSIFIFYVLWGLLPSSYLFISYMPDKYFVVLVPMVVLVSITVFAFLIYPSINMSLTPNIGSIFALPQENSTADTGDDITSNFEASISEKHMKKPTSVEELVVECEDCRKIHNLKNIVVHESTIYLDIQNVNKRLF